MKVPASVRVPSGSLLRPASSDEVGNAFLIGVGAVQVVPLLETHLEAGGADAFQPHHAGVGVVPGGRGGDDDGVAIGAAEGEALPAAVELGAGLLAGGGQADGGIEGGDVLPVGDAVAVGVGIIRVGAGLVFLKVGEPVAVAVEGGIGASRGLSPWAISQASGMPSPSSSVSMRLMMPSPSVSVSSRRNVQVSAPLVETSWAKS